MPKSANSSAPRVVAFGGGTGMSCLLSGLKRFTPHLTAIVTVTDNGGSSGRLRKEFDMVPPGDIRACLLALAEGEPWLPRLLDYRFEESELKGHSFGNLFITVMTRVTGSFDVAVRELNRLLQVRGRVLPATGTKVSLIARHPDGSKSTGEVQISESGQPIERVEMRPRVGPVADDVRCAIEEADLMVFGPGSLFTSVIPNLLVTGIPEAISENACPKVYVANIMTQPGETTGLSLGEHLDALERHAGMPLITGVVLHEGEISGPLLDRYSEDGAFPVAGGAGELDGRDVEIAVGNLVDPESATVRHSPERLAGLIHESFLCGLPR